MTPRDVDDEITKALEREESFPTHAPIKDAIGKTMLPRSYALTHPAAPMLKKWALHGCPVDCGPNWPEEHIIAALQKGPHISSTHKEAIIALELETAEKIAGGYARVVKWKDIKGNLPPKLKLSPVAMVPHKSRKFRTILDLSFRLKYQGTHLESVNGATNKKAPPESMVQLGLCLHRLVAKMADNHNPEQPFVFSKIDIKDGFWRLAVNDEDAWNFCYVKPSTNPTTSIDDTEIVVPNSLQMGWCESPPFFCAATETARDVIEGLIKEASLPQHKFEHQMMQNAPALNRLQAATTWSNLLEVFVDDFVGATNCTTTAHLAHLSRAMLLGIHSIFPPPEISGHNGEDPISQKKMKAGDGTWDTTKEILGWILDGLNYTIQLPPTKCTAIAKSIKNICKMKACPLNKYQKIAGKLQHASFGITGGQGPVLSHPRRLTRNPKVHHHHATHQAIPSRLALFHPTPRKIPYIRPPPCPK